MPWSAWFADDPRARVLAADDPAARWLLLTGVLERPSDDADVVTARAAVLASDATRALVERLPDWEAGVRLSGHESPAFAPNTLNLLADMGVRAGDFDSVDRILESMLRHQDDDGRFMSFGAPRGGNVPVWGALLCDSHAIVESLVRYGFGDDARVRAGLDRMIADLTSTAQGRCWPCRPDALSGFRGPGRKDDFCPQVTVEALRAWGRLPADRRPAELHEAAHVLLRAWRQRSSEKPYMFGHGRSFKTIKWPPTWYRVDAVLDAVSGFPEVWREPTGHAEDRDAVAELLACLLAYNVDGTGQVVPRGIYRGFESFGFGQKKVPDTFACARILAVLQPFVDMESQVRRVDVTLLASSKGGSGKALPP